MFIRKVRALLLTIILLVSLSSSLMFQAPLAASNESQFPVDLPNEVKQVITPPLANVLSELGLESEEHVNVIIKCIPEAYGKVINELEGKSGVYINRTIKPLSLISITATPAAIMEIAKISGVEKLFLNYKVKVPILDLRRSIEFFNANATFIPGETYPHLGTYPTFLNEIAELVNATDLYEMGYTGEGVIVAVLDTGINDFHPDLNGKVIGWYSAVPEEPDPYDYFGHGTHVASIIAGKGVTGSVGYIDYVQLEPIEYQIAPGMCRGIAPGASLLNVKVLSREGWGYAEWIIDGIIWAVEHGADVISMSLGGYSILPPEADPLYLAIQWAIEQGVVVVVAAGNEGPGYFSISSPAYELEVISVGACYKTGEPAFFSSRGPAPYWMWPKPDIIAPGVAVIAAYAGFNGKWNTTWAGLQPEGIYYLEGWGTSMATPVVSGVVALLLQAFPGATPRAIKAALVSGAKDLGYDESEQGAGLVDALKAYEILSLNLTNRLISVQPKSVTELMYYPYEELRSMGYLSSLFVAITYEDSSDMEELSSAEWEMWEEGAYTFFITPEDANESIVGYIYGEEPWPFDVLIIYNPRNSTRYNITALVEWVKIAGGSLIVIGDDNIDLAAAITESFNITWRSVAGGGLSTEIISHLATTQPYDVASVYFGGPLASLEVIGENATVIVMDPFYPGVAVWESEGSGRVVVVSDNDLFTKSLYREHNRELLINLVYWAGFQELISPPKVGALYLELEHPVYAYSNATTLVTLHAVNIGLENITAKLVLEVYDEFGDLVNSTSKVVRLDAGESDYLTIEFTIETMGLSYANVTAYVPSYNYTYTEVIYGFEFSYNFIIWDAVNQSVEIAVVNKTLRSGPACEVLAILPKEISSFSAPLITAFPGDFKIINLELITSAGLVDASLVIEGNITEIAGFMQLPMGVYPAVHRVLRTNWDVYWGLYEPIPCAFIHGPWYLVGSEVFLGNVTESILTQLLQIEAVNPGTYTGYIKLLNGSDVLIQVPVEIIVREPIAKILHDDVHHFTLTEYLWGGVYSYIPVGGLFRWWKGVAEAGIDVDSLRQVMFDFGIDDPWSIMYSSEYKAASLIGCEEFLARTEALPKLLDAGKSIIFAYAVPIEWTSMVWGWIAPELITEYYTYMVFAGVAEHFNTTHPIAWGVSNITHLYYATTLVIRENAELVATAVEHAYRLPWLHREVFGGATAGAYEHSETQAKFILIGDHFLFRYGLVEDENWFYMYYYTAGEVNVKKTDNLRFTVNVAKYAVNDPPEISVEVPEEVEPGEVAPVSLNLADDLSNIAKVKVEVSAPYVGRFFETVLEPNRGEYEGVIEVPLKIESPLGTYEVEITALDDMGDYRTSTTTFNVVGFEAEVIEAKTMTLAGLEKSEFEPGEFVVINATVATRYEIPSLVVAEVFTPEMEPIFIGVLTTQIRPGERIGLATGFTLPLNAVAGTYTVKIFVWTTWPGIPGWRPLAEVYEMTFEVRP